MSFEHDRYVVFRKYFGKFDDFSPYCYTDNIKTAILLCRLLNEEYKDRPIKFIYGKRKACTDYEPCLDNIDFQVCLSDAIERDKNTADPEADRVKENKL